MPRGQIDAALLNEAIQALKINVPIYGARLVGDRLELYLYGGRTVSYSLPPAREKESTKPKPPAKPRPAAPKGKTK